ncbi:MAG: hydrolase [Candidatus Hydrogenedentota bacterium]
MDARLFRRLRWPLLVASAMLVIAGAGCPATTPAERESMQYQDETRTYILHVSPQYTGKKSVPLVIALHGMPLTGDDMQRRSGFDAVADRNGFIVCYPDGLNFMWNSNPLVPESAELPDDVGFLCALIDELCSEYAIDERRVFIVGMSNGGMMAYRLACEAGDRLAGVACVISTFPLDYDSYCTPQGPVPILLMLGTEDPIFPWNGGYDMFGNICYQSVDETVAYWIDNNNAKRTPDVEVFADVNSNDGATVCRLTYQARWKGASVVLYRVDNGGHTWPGCAAIPLEKWLGVGNTCQDINATEEVWRFFSSAHCRPRR